jgi:hypothetical protein
MFALPRVDPLRMGEQLKPVITRDCRAHRSGRQTLLLVTVGGRIASARRSIPYKPQPVVAPFDQPPPLRK